MRISQTVVQQVADYAKSFTDGAFRLQAIGGDIGRGTRYIDGIEHLVWLGKGGNQEAAAYYIGAMLGWARHTATEIPDDVREYCKPVQEAYQFNRKAMEQQTRGETTAEFRARSK